MIELRFKFTISQIIFEDNNKENTSFGEIEKSHSYKIRHYKLISYNLLRYISLRNKNIAKFPK